MANALHRDIEVGEVVVIDPKYIMPEFADDTRFQVKGGFGRLNHTVGRKVFGTWLADNSETVFYGFMISPELTDKYQTEQKKEDTNV